MILIKSFNSLSREENNHRHDVNKRPMRSRWTLSGKASLGSAKFEEFLNQHARVVTYDLIRFTFKCSKKLVERFAGPMHRFWSSPNFKRKPG